MIVNKLHFDKANPGRLVVFIGVVQDTKYIYIYIYIHTHFVLH